MLNTSPLTIETLKGFIPFQVFSDSQLEYLLSYFCRLYARKGQILLDYGSSKSETLFLAAGSVGALQSGKTLTPSQAYSLNMHCQNKEVLVALSDCSLLQINRNVFDRFVCWAESAHYLENDIASQHHYELDQDWIWLLLASNLFYKVSPLKLQGVFSQFHSVPVQKGQVIIQQGEIGDCCYFIKEGSALVSRRVLNEKEKMVLAEIGVGRCFGEDALIHDAVRNATITMQSDGLLMRMEKRDFLQLLKDPAVEMLSSIDLDMSLQTGSVLIDVRSSEEYAYQHLKGALCMPLGTLCLHSRALDQQGCYVVYCDTERRSRAAAYFLSRKGFRARALSGGLDLLPDDENFLLVSL